MRVHLSDGVAPVAQVNPYILQVTVCETGLTSPPICAAPSASLVCSLHNLANTDFLLHSIALGLTYPDSGGAMKLLSASVSNAILMRKSSCPSPASTYISIVSGAGILYRASRDCFQASSYMIGGASSAWSMFNLPLRPFDNPL
jgi:hypothetical protein